MQLLIELAKFCGIVNAIFFPMFVFIGIKKYKKFDFFKNTISDCSNIDQSRRFNLSVVLVGFLYTVFSFAIYNHYELSNGFPIYLISFSGISLFLAGIIPKHKRSLTHKMLGIIAFVFAGAGFYVLHFLIIQVDYFVGIFAFVMTIITIVGSVITLLKFGVCIIPQLFFVVMGTLWNLFFSYVIFFR
jgi:hypothetical membrane protein